nr:hypothetical protein [Tanacetum cinerariifolium]
MIDPTSLLLHLCSSDGSKIRKHDCNAIKGARAVRLQRNKMDVVTYETADDPDQPSDNPFDPRKLAEVICVPKKKKDNRVGCSQEEPSQYFNQLIAKHTKTVRKAAQFIFQSSISQTFNPVTVSQCFKTWIGCRPRHVKHAKKVRA